MTTVIRTHTARVAHFCEGCHPVPSEHDTPTIAPGHRYLLHTAFPDGDLNVGDRPYSVKECIACLSTRDSAAPLLEAGACATYCHGVTPCARPFRHDGDHECKQCLAEKPAELVSAQP